ncbi:MAG: hypothetical protein IJ093_01755, partial [Bacilli bacterium]|nr:hypothetical protein [Bacilli bacterium]
KGDLINIIEWSKKLLTQTTVFDKLSSINFDNYKEQISTMIADNLSTKVESEFLDEMTFFVTRALNTVIDEYKHLITVSREISEKNFDMLTKEDLENVKMLQVRVTEYDKLMTASIDKKYYDISNIVSDLPKKMQSQTLADCKDYFNTFFTYVDYIRNFTNKEVSQVEIDQQYDGIVQNFNECKQNVDDYNSYVYKNRSVIDENGIKMSIPDSKIMHFLSKNKRKELYPKASLSNNIYGMRFDWGFFDLKDKKMFEVKQPIEELENKNIVGDDLKYSETVSHEQNEEFEYYETNSEKNIKHR